MTEDLCLPYVFNSLEPLVYRKFYNVNEGILVDNTKKMMPRYTKYFSHLYNHRKKISLVRLNGLDCCISFKVEFLLLHFFLGNIIQYFNFVVEIYEIMGSIFTVIIFISYFKFSSIAWTISWDLSFWVTFWLYGRNFKFNIETMIKYCWYNVKYIEDMASEITFNNANLYKTKYRSWK